ncbi:MAG TPA: hypothetical protein V6D15_23725 [Oculatellaceae cyanobacterium]|jgi:hypothetical protein
MTFPFKSRQQNNQSGIGINSSSQTQSGLTPQPKTLEELEKELEAQFIPTRPHQQSSKIQKNRGGLKKIKFVLILSAVFVGLPWLIVWVANQPDRVIRSAVAEKYPILLLPSYRKMEGEYKQAIASVEQAQQLVDHPTSPADLNLGEQKVNEAQKHLDALPISFLSEWPEYRYWWYDWRFNIYKFNSDREKIGQLAAKVFQEKNAQTFLSEGQQALNTAKQQYQQASTPTDKQTAIASWSSALDQLEQIPSETLAGKTSQKKLEAYKRDYQEIVGLAAGNERISTLIAAAKQFSMQAAVASQNPPHSVSQWEQIEGLWQQAIVRLAEIPPEDLAGYAIAQKSLAEYQANLGQIKIRKQYEADSVSALEQSQSAIQNLIASTPTDAKLLDRNRTISQIQGIINQLEKVKPGTTSYLKAQELLLSAQNKLKQLQPQ